MVFILLRHGQSIWNKCNILAGWNNIPLTQLGRNEARNAGIILKKYNFDYIFTSDLERAIETSDIVKNELKQNFCTKSSPDLKERNYGILAGKTKDDLENLFGKEQVKRWRRSYWGRPPEGENLDDVKNRFGLYYDKNIKPLVEDNKNVLVISHSNSIRALFVHLGLKNEKTIEDFEIDNCNPINIDIKNKKFWYEK
jgi:2,3-bisphosphoglycerate-dependent phosphoglycerate mutase